MDSDPIHVSTGVHVARVIATKKGGGVSEVKPPSTKEAVKSAKKSLKRFGKSMLLRTAQATGGIVMVGTLPIRWPLTLLGLAVDRSKPNNSIDADGFLETVKSHKWEKRANAVGSFSASLLYDAATDELKQMKKTKK